ncbi:MAG: hypothetical protein JSS56_20730 [Proteobacteria bacterium]|nr:hypothetical protein [Pseudomonadota bacterium]
MAAATGWTHASAQSGVIVNDTQSMSKAIAEYAEQAKRWADTVAQYQQQLQHYQQMLSTAMNANFQGVLPTSALQKITDESSIIQQACPDSAVVAGAVSTITGVDLQGPIHATALKLCAQKVHLQIDSYNSTIDLLERMPKYGGLLQQIDNLRNALGSSNSIGNLQANTNEAARTSNKLDSEFINWQSRIRANETAIATLDSQMSLVAQISLKGQGSIFGKVVSAAAFAKAFH